MSALTETQPPRHEENIWRLNAEKRAAAIRGLHKTNPVLMAALHDHLPQDQQSTPPVALEERMQVLGGKHWRDKIISESSLTSLERQRIHSPDMSRADFRRVITTIAAFGTEPNAREAIALVDQSFAIFLGASGILDQRRAYDDHVPYGHSVAERLVGPVLDMGGGYGEERRKPSPLTLIFKKASHAA